MTQIAVNGVIGWGGPLGSPGCGAATSVRLRRVVEQSDRDHGETHGGLIPCVSTV